MCGDSVYIDSHCHVFKSEYEDPEYVIKNAIKCGINKLLKLFIKKKDLQTMFLISFINA